MSKYLSKKCEYNGITFDSKKEMKRYITLTEDEGVTNLQTQVRYLLIPNQREESTFNSKGKEIPGKVIERKCEYVADFVYDKDGETIVEDVKGYRMGGAYAVFTIKRKLMLEKYGIRVREV